MFRTKSKGWLQIISFGDFYRIQQLLASHDQEVLFSCNDVPIEWETFIEIGILAEMRQVAKNGASYDELESTEPDSGI